MDVCVICLDYLRFNNLSTAKNIRNYELLALCDWLKSRERNVDLITKVNNHNRDCHYVVDISNWDPTKYDEVYLYNSNPNFYGGVPDISTLEAYYKFSKVTGKVFYVLADPKMICTNKGETFFNRLTSFINRNKDKEYNDLITAEIMSAAYKITPTVIDECSKRFNSMTVLSTGVDYLYVYNHSKDPNILNLPCEMIDLIKFESAAFFKDRLKDTNYRFDTKVFDLVYFGNNRNSGRNNLISKYFDNPEFKSIIIGFDPNKYLNLKNLSSMEYIDYLAKDKLYDFIEDKCLATLVLGDTICNGHALSLRFAESLLLKCVGFISIEYDPNKEMIKSEFLKDFIYVSSSEELSSKLNRIKQDKSLYEKLILAELEEFKSI